MRISLAVDYHIHRFNGASVEEIDSGITNGIVEDRAGELYVTQRPSIDVFDDASENASDARGRAIYHWAAADDLYLLNNDTIYKNSHATTVSSSPTAGVQKCKFIEAGDYLVLLDAENDQGFTITTGDVVTEITDTDFPPKQGTPVGLAHGGAVLDTYLFVLGENGIIYNSSTGDPTAWGALDYLAAERDTDGGKYLGKHHDNIVVYGDRTIEFFYDAANQAGSPLARRQDISHQIGCASGESVWEEGDRAFFVGANWSGALAVYLLEGFGIRKISTSHIDSYLTQAIDKDGYSVTGCGLTAHGHTFYIMTMYLADTDIVPYITLVYDVTTGLWGEWETTVNGLSKFPLMAWSTRNGTESRYGEGILANGDMITVNDNMTPEDTLLSSTYVVAGYVATGYYVTAGSSSANIALTIRTGQADGGSDVKKIFPNIRVVQECTPSSSNMTVKWAKGNNETFSAGVTIDTSKYQRINRIGECRKINFQIEYSGDQTVRIDAIEAEPIRGRS